MQLTQFVIADPHARVFEAGGKTWMVSGSDPAMFQRTVIRAAEKGAGIKETLLELSRVAEEGTFAAVETCGEGTARTTLFKTLSSTFDLYYRIQGGAALVFDHFRNALASIPVSERSPDEEAFADQILFAYEYLPGEHTFLEGVFKVTQGSLVEIGPDGRRRVEQVEILRPPAEGPPPGAEEAVDRLDKILTERVSAYSGSFGNPAVLFSGGVDSTLVLSGLEAETPALTVGTDTPEYAFEMEYARKAAGLLKADHRLTLLEESNFRGLVSELVETLGQPSEIAFFQSMAFHVAFQQPYDLFLTGESVDALFGFNKLAKIYGETGLSPSEKQSLALDAESEEGFACLYGLSPDFETARRVLGEDRVRRRLRARLDFCFQCFPEPAGTKAADRRQAHAEIVYAYTLLAHTKEYVGRTRQQAFCRGRTVMTPFACRSVLDLALSLPLPERIVKDGVVKHVAKSLLAKRLPGYPVHTRKGGSDVPRTRFLQEGPLEGIFLEEKLPRFWPGEFAEILLRPQRETSFLVLNALGYALWQNRVLDNPALEPVPGTRTFRAPAGEEIEP